MQKKNSPPQSLSFAHPFFVILGVIIIFYAGYLFGVKLHELFHWSYYFMLTKIWRKNILVVFQVKQCKIWAFLLFYRIEEAKTATRAGFNQIKPIETPTPFKIRSQQGFESIRPFQLHIIFYRHGYCL